MTTRIAYDPNRVLTFTDAIREGTSHLLMIDPRIHVLGLGATYPNGLDGTMGNLATTFKDRVHDMPCSENAITGMAVGMAVSGLRPVVHHGRIEFALHAMDQILTQAAKWNYMFGGDYPCPIIIRIAIGRQWGNGPQHTLANKSLFAVPELRVVCPSTPEQARDLLIKANMGTEPVIYLENRWLYKTKQLLRMSEFCVIESYEPRIMKRGTDYTVVAVGDTVLEALKAAKSLRGRVDIEVIDLVSIYPMSLSKVLESAQKTGRLLVVDSSTPEFSISSEVIAQIMPKCSCVASALTASTLPCPTAPSLTTQYYPTSEHIENKILDRPLDCNLRRAFNELNLPPMDNFSDLME